MFYFYKVDVLTMEELKALHKFCPSGFTVNLSDLPVQSTKRRTKFLLLMLHASFNLVDYLAVKFDVILIHNLYMFFDSFA